MSARTFVFGSAALVIAVGVLAAWLAPRHPQSIHARRNRKGWDR